MQCNGIEMLVIQAAREVKDGETVFAGVGLPIMAMAVAKKFYSPNITILCESGVVDTFPTRLALSIADPSLVDNSSAVFTPNEIFSYFLQGGHIDVGVLGGAQIDRYGNINSTVIGPYVKPKVRMPGSGGACEIAINSKSIITLMPQGKRRFVEKVDFVTSPGHVLDVQRVHMRGKGPRAVVSDMGVYRFDEENKEMYLSGLFDGVTVDTVKENTGWAINIGSKLESIPLPTEDELKFIRDLDPDGLFLGKKA